MLQVKTYIDDGFLSIKFNTYSKLEDIRGFMVVDDDSDFDILLRYTPYQDQEYFVLAVEYTRSPIGKQSKTHVCFIDMYQTFEDATTNAGQIRKTYEPNAIHPGWFMAEPPTVSIQDATGAHFLKERYWEDVRCKLNRIAVISVHQNSGLYDF